MLKNLKEFSKLISEYKQNWKSELADIVVFGSIVRGKSNPNDIDVCLIFRNKADLNIIKKVQAILGDNYHIISLTVDNFFTNPHSLAKTLLLEGESLITGKKFADVFSLKAKVIYYYDISKEEASKKVRFVYLLRGRVSSNGLVKELNGEFISNSAFLIPIENDAKIQEVFNSWKVKYKRIRVMLIY